METSSSGSKTVAHPTDIRNSEAHARARPAGKNKFLLVLERDDRQGAMFLAARPDGYLHILAQSREKYTWSSCGVLASNWQF
jgi:hypothetical protein